MASKTLAALLTMALALALTPGQMAHALDPDAAAGQPASPRLGFITSVTGSLAFGTWPDAGGQVGLAAADQICSTRATIAGLPDPASFVAWLSDSSNDAWCRVHGLDGKRANNCGQAVLPANAGPWRDTTGRPLLAALPGGLGGNGAHYTAIGYSEFGQLASGSWEPVPTGTNADGVAAGALCADWTDTQAAGAVTFGNSARTTVSWTDSVTPTCAIPNRRLYCLQAGPGPALPAQRWARLAFVTTATGSGHLSTWTQAGGAEGVAAGDNVCRAEAAAAGAPHPASFKAWMGAGATGPGTRFANDGPWRRPDGVRVADDLADLTSGRLQAPINQTLQGTYLGGGVLAWTGAGADGSVRLNCDGWSTAEGQGVPGWVNATYTSWSAVGEGPCSEAMHLYCLSDSDELYVDGFNQPPLL